MNKADLFKKMLEEFPDVELKGKTMPYTSINGNMFSFFDKEGDLHLRLSKNDRDEFLTCFPDNISIQHGVLMKEYVRVHEIIFDDGSLSKHFRKSLDYSSKLKSKSKK